MYRFFLVIFILLTVVFFACAAERDKPAPTGEPSGEATTTEEPAMIPADAISGTVTNPAGANVPGVETGEAVGAITPDGTSTTFVDDKFLSEYVRAIIVNDREYLKKFSTEEFFEDIDKTIAEIGLRDFLENEDYDALWEKVGNASSLSLTALSGEMIIGLWNLNGQDSGLKDFTVQFEMNSFEDGYKVFSYMVF